MQDPPVFIDTKILNSFLVSILVKFYFKMKKTEKILI